MNKAELRKVILEKRESLDDAELSRKSENIFQNLKETPFFRDASCIGLFSPIRSEVRTEKIFHLARKLGKKVGFPLTIVSKKNSFSLRLQI